MAENEKVTNNNKTLPVITFETFDYKGVVLIENGHYEEIETMETRQDDIWVCSFPRSGERFICLLKYIVSVKLW